MSKQTRVGVGNGYAQRLLPQEVLNIYEAILNQTDSKDQSVDAGYSEMKKEKIPNLYFQSDVELIKAMNSDNMTVLFFKPCIDFNIRPKDMQAWSIIGSQTSCFASRNDIRNGFYNIKQQPVYFRDFTFDRKNRIERMIFCVSFYKNIIIEVVYDFSIENISQTSALGKQTE